MVFETVAVALESKNGLGVAVKKANKIIIRNIGSGAMSWFCPISRIWEFSVFSSL